MLDFGKWYKTKLQVMNISLLIRHTAMILN
nr:MAG TPA: hypothetical protein [Caudoviricetes sp.]